MIHSRIKSTPNSVDMIKNTLRDLRTKTSFRWKYTSTSTDPIYLANGRSRKCYSDRSFVLMLPTNQLGP